MKSKQSSNRAALQRSIPSTLLFRPLVLKSKGSSKEAEIKSPGDNRPKISLSDFLNKKLQKNSSLPGSVQGKKKQFISPVGDKDAIRFPKENENASKDDASVHCALDVIFEKFKHSNKGEDHDDIVSDSVETVTSGTEDMERSKKRRNMFEGTEYEKPARKVLAVLGEDSNSRQCRKGKARANVEKPTNYFNHYANGQGWWDCDKEGVDNEEVGFSEIWESRNSTTLGGLDWY